MIAWRPVASSLAKTTCSCSWPSSNTSTDMGAVLVCCRCSRGVCDLVSDDHRGGVAAVTPRLDAPDLTLHDEVAVGPVADERTGGRSGVEADQEPTLLGLDEGRPRQVGRVRRIELADLGH